MPELPEVEVVRRSLEPRLIGDTVRRVEVREERLRERIRVQRLEEKRVLSRYEGVPDPGFGHYLLYCLHLRSENPLRTAIPASAS